MLVANSSDCTWYRWEIPVKTHSVGWESVARQLVMDCRARSEALVFTIVGTRHVKRRERKHL
jgi:hypothetical protein